MPQSNNKSNFGIIIKGFYGVPYFNDIELTNYEMKMLSKYIFDDLQLHKSKEIDFNSVYVKFAIDFLRYYLFQLQDLEL